MPKGKEAQINRRQKFNNLNLNDLKSSIRKMSDYANSSSSSGGDSFADGNEAAILPNNAMDVTPEHQGENPAEQPKDKFKLPDFKKKVKFLLSI